MILLGYNWGKISVGILCVSLAILVLIIAYRKLIAYLGKTDIIAEKYCILHNLENNPSYGELEFYFTCGEPKMVTLSILNEDTSLNQVLVSKDFKVGGNIIRFDSTKLTNGTFFYQLETDNQKTMKKMLIQNN